MDNFEPDQQIENTNTEQEEVVQKLKNVLEFFESVRIKNEESLAYIKKPLDDLLSSLKYLPVDQGSGFSDLPVELKTDILGYVCDSGAFVAATVCGEWKSIVEPRLRDLDYVGIGKCCSNAVYCAYTYDDDANSEKMSCFMPEEILKASITLGLDIPIAICYPVKHVDPKLLIKGLKISDFKINSGCYCREDENGSTDDEPLLSEVQGEHLLEAMEKETEIHNVELNGVDMTHLDQDRLIDCLFKVEKLTLAEGSFSDWIDQWSDPDPILDFDLFIEKLLQVSSEVKLSYLKLEYMQYSETLSVDFANALCNIKRVTLGQYFPLRRATLQQLVKNILREQTKMKYLYISRSVDWQNLITAEDLKMIMRKMERICLCGKFTREQVEEARSLPGVKAVETTIKKNIFTSVKIYKDPGE